MHAVIAASRDRANLLAYAANGNRTPGRRSGAGNAS